MNIGFIGAGKVGCTLGKYFSKDFRTTIVGYYSRSSTSADEAARFTDSESFPDMKALIEASDAIFLTVPDGNIRDTWNRVREYDITDKMICHCSGSMSCKDAFPDLEKTNALGYSVHPLFAVSDKFNAYKELTDVFFTIEPAATTVQPEETSAEALPLSEDGAKHIQTATVSQSERTRNQPSDAGLRDLTALIRRLGNPYRIIDGEDKTTYHCAAAVASNLMCALADMSIGLMQNCGFAEDEAIKALAPILRGNTEHIIRSGPVKAFTGPVERNDIETVAKHLACLQDRDDKEIYRLLTGRLVHMAEQRHPDIDYAGMSKLIEKGEKQ